MVIRYNPFNPQQPAKPHFFVGREQERKSFETFLLQTIHSSPMNLAITGDRGMGKTSILRKFEEIAKENNCLTIRLSDYEGNINDVIEFSDFLVTNIQTELISRDLLSRSLENISKFVSSLKPEFSIGDVSISLEKKQIVQELLRKRLLDIWDNVSTKYTSIIILFDEAESLEKLGVLTFLREVFQRVQEKANYMVVLAGKFNFSERMSESFSPLNRFFPVERLRKLDKLNVAKYIRNQLSETDITINEEAINIIFNKTEGHPYVLVQSCFIIFDSMLENEFEINVPLVNRTLQKVKGKLTQDFFLPMFHPLRPKAKKILCQIARNSQGLKFSFDEARKWNKIRANELSPYLGELIAKGVINKPRRSEYEIFHTLFKEFLKVQNC